MQNKDEEVYSDGNEDLRTLHDRATGMDTQWEDRCRTTGVDFRKFGPGRRGNRDRSVTRPLGGLSGFG